MVYTNPCRTCPYWWQEEDEDFPTCKYVGNPEYAPCEVEEDYPSDDPALWEEESLSFAEENDYFEDNTSYYHNE